MVTWQASRKLPSPGFVRPDDDSRTSGRMSLPVVTN